MYQIVMALAVALPLIGGGAFASIAVAAPFHPGDSLFAAQQLADQARIALTFDPAQRAAFELDIADRRLADLEASVGSQAELTALAYFDAALAQAVGTIAVVPPERVGDLRTRLGVLTVNALDTLSRLTVLPTTAPQVLANARAKLIAMGAAAVDSAKSGDDLILASVTNLGITPEIAAAAHSFYPLTGAHATLVGTTCHSSGVYKGTRTTCAGCHTKVRPANHFVGDCASCHTTSAWTPATFDHSTLTDCQNCHLKDKPANHYEGQCSACHATKAWTPATYNHAGVTTCAGCHTQNKPASHFDGECSACHKDTTDWKNATF
ncbi:MAG: cytochrome c3 family protein, partial [Chloroflexi bacterium]|nr:cytochrome c3 family protein [Chloroflexota bacterium]